MIYVDLPPGRRLLPFYLATEEHVARCKPAGEYFFMWQVEPSVIFGRNQLIENEVNLDFCRSHGIAAFRRKSGGGCVYADMGNVMFSYITPSDDVTCTFGRYLGMVVAMLRTLGVEATATGRNDIMIDGRKVSGNAFYHIAGRSIVHGTMLYDTDMENMAGSITPSTEKLATKGVKSVSQRIALLKDHTTLSLAEFIGHARRELCDTSIELGEEDVERITAIERQYLTDEFIYGHNPSYNVTRRRRIEGVGELEARLEIKNGVIRSVNIVGDYFLVGDIDNRVITPLRGTRLTREAIAAALPGRLDDVIAGLGKDDFVALLAGL